MLWNFMILLKQLLEFTAHFIDGLTNLSFLLLGQGNHLVMFTLLFRIFNTGGRKLRVAWICHRKFCCNQIEQGNKSQWQIIHFGINEI